MRAGIALLALASLALAFAPRSVWDGVYTEEQAKRGAALYARECAGCHGVSLTGGEEAPPLSGTTFVSNWNGLTLGDLFERTRTTMPQNDPSKVSRAQHADILAYILSVNRFPAGKAELDKQTEVLKEIRFETERPAKADAP
jgi:mono/diheme cytochrome c family protein